MYMEQATTNRSAQTYSFSKDIITARLDTKIVLVELSGIEPLTPCLQSRCSPS